MSPVDDPEFVTIPEVCRRLGISDRQARRWIARLPDADRSCHGRVRVVRFSAVEALRREAVPDYDTLPDTKSDIEASPPGHDIDTSGHDHDGDIDASGSDVRALRAELEQLRGEYVAADKRAAVAEAVVVELRERVSVADAALASALEAIREKDRQLAESDTRMALVLAGTGRLNLTPRDQAADASEPETGQGSAEQARAASEGPQDDRADKAGETDKFEPIAIPVAEGATGAGSEPDGQPAVRESADASARPVASETGDSGRRLSWWARLWGGGRA